MPVPQQWCRFCVAQIVKATDFEYRHQTLVHLLIVAASFLTYFLDRNDIVWALARRQSHPELLERLLFSIATILIGLSTAIRTWARAYQGFSVPSYASPGRRDGPYRYVLYPRQLGNLLFSVGLGFLAPIPGFVLLVISEAIIFLRLVCREKELTLADTSQPSAWRPLYALEPMWADAFREESAKWGLLLTMIVLTALLKDGVAEILAAVSFAVWALLNCRSFRSLTER